MGPDTLKAIIRAMQIGDQQNLADKLLLEKTTDAENILELLDFSARILMPWAGIAVARAAIERAKNDAKRNQALFLGVISRNNLLDGFEEADEWKQVVKVAAEAVASVVEDAVHWPGFAASVSMDILYQIVHNIQDGEWVTEQNVSICCDQDSVVQGSGQAMLGLRPGVKACPDGTIGVYVCMSEGNPCIL